MVVNSKVVVIWFSDSQNCVRIISAGSTKFELQQEALNIFQLYLNWNIDLDLGTLIAPKWPSASFWPIIFQEGRIKRDFVKEIPEFSTGQDIFVKDKGNRVFLEQKRLKAKSWL